MKGQQLLPANAQTTQCGRQWLLRKKCAWTKSAIPMDALLRIREQASAAAIPVVRQVMATAQKKPAANDAKESDWQSCTSAPWECARSFYAPLVSAMCVRGLNPCPELPLRSVPFNNALSSSKRAFRHLPTLPLFHLRCKGATLDKLAARSSHGSSGAIGVSSVYLVRGLGAVFGAACSSALFSRYHGNHVLGGTFAVLSIVLLTLPACTDTGLLHLLFVALGYTTATIDTGVQIMTRKAHGKSGEAGAWLGGNTVSFGVTGALVPLVSLAFNDRLLYIYMAFAVYALTIGVLLLFVEVL